MRVEFREQMVAVVARDLLHRYVHVLSHAGRLGAAVLVDDGKLVGVAEVDERLSVAMEVQVDAAVLVVVVRLWRRVRVGEAEAARVRQKRRRVVAGVVAPAAIRRGPVRLFELRGVVVVEPAVSVGGNGGLEVEVVAHREAERELVVVRRCGLPERITRLAVDGLTAARHGDVAEQEVVRRILFVDEDDVLDLPALDARAVRDGVVSSRGRRVLDEAVVAEHRFGHALEVVALGHRDGVHRSHRARFGRA
jgi:hypothetical protein